MVLGKHNECWICYHPRDNTEQKCYTVKGKTNTICENCKIWLCKECIKKVGINWKGEVK